MNNLDVYLSGVVLEESGSIRRNEPRKESEQQGNYKQLFDYYRIFADIYFKENGDIEMIGPPMLNLKKYVEEAEFYINGGLVAGKDIFIEELNRMSRTLIKGSHAQATTLEIRVAGQTFVRNIQKSHLNFFRDKKVLITQQKDNPIEWIVYWILYHIEHHKIDSVLIYDNGSLKYSIDELRKSIQMIDKLDGICIIRWDVLWGPTGGNSQVWDSDYGQHQCWMHALGRFVGQAKSVIIDDVDELPLHSQGLAITDIIEEIDEPVLLFKRRNILDVGIDANPRLHCHTHMYDSNSPLISPKYAFNPKKINVNTQLLVHRVVGSSTHEAIDIIARHFLSLRMDWRNGNYQVIPLQNKENFKHLEIDEQLLLSFESVNKEYNRIFGGIQT